MRLQILHKTVTLLKLIISSLFGWIILVPLALVIPKKKQIVFLEQSAGKFYDNVKYFYLYLCRHPLDDIKCVYLTRSKGLYNELNIRGFPVAMESSLRGKWLMLRTKIAIEDGLGISTHLKYFFLFSAWKVQLWHGTAIKKVELQMYAKYGIIKGTLLRLFWTYAGRHSFYHLFISSSAASTRNYSSAFKYGESIEAGYPRNDQFFLEPDELFMLGVDVIARDKIKLLKQKGYKIILYMPTFRDSRADAIGDGALDIRRLAMFGDKNRIAFILKFHVNNIRTDTAGLFSAENFICYDNLKDVYPILPLVDLLVTDYSSVFFDFLLLDKPIVFFPYDYEKYMERDRGMVLDYDKVIPGAKCKNQGELEREIKATLCAGVDFYAEKRNEIRNLFWEYADGKASERIRDRLKMVFLT